jgi:hypothetical protein
MDILWPFRLGECERPKFSASRFDLTPPSGKRRVTTAASGYSYTVIVFVKSPAFVITAMNWPRRAWPLSVLGRGPPCP